MSAFRKLNNWVVNVMRDINGDRASDLENNGAEAQLTEFNIASISKLADLVNHSAGTECMVHAVTVRSSYRLASTYMRPVYSVPPELGEYIERPEVQKPFSFEYSGDTSPFEGVFDLHGCDGTEAAECAMGIYEINGSSSPGEQHSTFVQRIEDFWHGLGDGDGDGDGDGGLVGNIRKKVVSGHRVFCLFAVRRKASAPNRFEADSMVALYFSLDTSPIDTFTTTLRDLQPVEIARELFNGIDLINNVDAYIFRTRGMELVSDLVPVFDRVDVSAADKIAFAIERLEMMLRGHLVGRHGATSGKLEIHYVSTTFEIQDNTRDVGNLRRRFMPMFRIYPNIYCLKNPLGALRVAHWQIPSAVKYLLHQYLESAGSSVMDTSVYKDLVEEAQSIGDPLESFLNQTYTTTAEAFRQLLSNLDTIDGPQLLDHLCPVYSQFNGTPENELQIRDTLLLSIHDHVVDELMEQQTGENRKRKTPWECLNQQVNAESPNRSLAAFVIEGAPLYYDGDKVRLVQLPRGILVLESKQVDPFTDSDLKSLRAVSRGIAALIRRITKDNSSLDFRVALMETQKGLTKVGRNDDEYLLLKRLLFCIRKVDLDELRKLYNTAAGRTAFVNEFNLDSPALELLDRLVSELAKGVVDGAPVEGQPDVEIVLRQRIPQALKIFNEPSSRTGMTESLADLLEAFTENAAYAGYFSAISQTLGTRVGKQGLPTFTLLKAGFSAVGVFSAQKDNEMRQVVKLSSSDKLLKELECYRRHVRYKILLAARIPADGFAFDNSGEVGRDRANNGGRMLGTMPDKYERNAYGVLVSDLVSGETNTEHFAKMPRQVVKTLLTTMVSCYTGPTRKHQDRGESPTGAGQRAYMQGLIDRYASDSVVIICRALVALVDRNQYLWQGTSDKRSAKQAQTLVRNAYRLPDGDMPNKKDIVQINRHKQLQDACELYRSVPGNNSVDLMDHWTAAHLEIDESSTQNLMTIMHGDLNARNLAWAGSIGHFFLIDFEHVGTGFTGADAFRLIINLITDAHSGAAESELKEPGRYALYASVDNAIKVVSALFKYFSSDDFDIEKVRQMKTKAELPEDLPDKLPTEFAMAKAVQLVLLSLFPDEKKRHEALVDPLLAIVCTLVNLVCYSRDPYQVGSEFGGFVSFAMSMAALKEFEYSSRTINSDAGHLSYLKDPIIDIPMHELVSLVDANESSESSRESYIRFLASAKILQSFLSCDAAE